MKYTETKDKVIIEFYKDSDEFEYGFKPMVEQMHMINAKTVNLASEIVNEMYKEHDEKNDMIAALSNIFSKVPDDVWDQIPNHEEHLKHIYAFVGETIGMFCCACWQLMSLSSSQQLKSAVDEAVEYYENNWNF